MDVKTGATLAALGALALAGAWGTRQDRKALESREEGTVVLYSFVANTLRQLTEEVKKSSVK